MSVGTIAHQILAAREFLFLLSCIPGTVLFFGALHYLVLYRGWREDAATGLAVCVNMAVNFTVQRCWVFVSCGPHELVREGCAYAVLAGLLVVGNALAMRAVRCMLPPTPWRYWHIPAAAIVGPVLTLAAYPFASWIFSS